MGKEIDEATETMQKQVPEAAEATQEQAAEARAQLGAAMEEKGNEMQKEAETSKQQDNPFAADIRRAEGYGKRSLSWCNRNNRLFADGEG